MKKRAWLETAGKKIVESFSRAIRAVGGESPAAFLLNCDYFAESLERRVMLSTATQLAFVGNVQDSAPGAISTFSIKVAVEDASGSTITTDASQVTVTLNGGTFSTNTNTLVGTAHNGVVSFSSLAIPFTGTYTVTATDGSLTPATSNTFSVFVPTRITGLSSQTQSTPVFDSNGNMFGTTSAGGTNGVGTVFELVKGSTTVATVASFNGTNGSAPFAGLVLDPAGNMFGTTTTGGTNNLGTVYEVAVGSNAITSIASFNGTNGADPQPALSIDSAGDLFGTTITGNGTVFEIAAGTNSITTIANFTTATGTGPFSGVTLDPNGNLFGATRTGPNNKGILFEIAKGSSSITTLASVNYFLNGNPTRITIDTSGDLFGSAVGDSSPIFELAKGANAATTIASIGRQLSNAIVLDSAGNLFGATDSSVFEVVHGTNSVVQFSISSIVGTSTSNNIGFNSSGDLLGVSNVVIYKMNAAPPTLSFFRPLTSTSAGSSISASVTITLPDGQSLSFGTTTVTLALDHGTFSTGSNTVATTISSSGSAFFSFQINIAGTYTVTASDSNATAITSNSFTISVGTYSKTIFVQQPTNFVAGTAMSTAVTVQPTDFYGNPVIFSFTTTLRLIDANGQYTFTSFITTAVNGLFTCSNISYQTAGSYTLEWNAGNEAKSAAFTIFPASPAAILLSTQPSSGASGPVIPSVTVNLCDRFGNTVTNDSSTVNLTINNGTFADGGTVVTTQMFNGQAVFANIAIDPGPGATLTVSDADLVPATVALTNTLTSFAPPAGTVAALAEDGDGDLFESIYGGSAGNGEICEIPFGQNLPVVLAPLDSTVGKNPFSIVSDVDGNIFGLASGGADNDGIIFELKRGTGAITTLATFDGANGQSPSTLTIDSTGNLFGTTSSGGPSGLGTIFRVDAGAHQITTIASFDNTIGSFPGPLGFDGAGNLYGVMSSGGPGGDGSVYELSVGANALTVLAAFDGTNSFAPAQLVVDPAGNVFVTTSHDDNLPSTGSVFEIPSDTRQLQLYYSLSFGFGRFANGLALDSTGNLYFGVVRAGWIMKISAGTKQLVELASVSPSLPSHFIYDNDRQTLYGMNVARNVYNVFQLSPANQLSFIHAPASATIGQALNSPTGVRVAVQDPFLNTVATDSSTVTLTLTGGIFSTGLNTATAQAINGIATFDNLVINAVGTYSLTASDGILTAATSASFDITPPAGSVYVTSTQINGDLAGTLGGNQRSMVEDIVYTFNAAVSIADANLAFTVVGTGAHAGVVPTSLSASPVSGSNGTQWAVTLSGQAPGVLASIANGTYSITINSAFVLAASDGTTPLYASRTDSFFRLFGDSNGDGTITNADLNRFKQAFGASGGVYNPIFDSDNDLNISNGDLNKLKQDFLVNYFA